MLIVGHTRRFRWFRCDVCGDVRIPFHYGNWTEIVTLPHRHLISAATRWATELKEEDYALNAGKVKALSLEANVPAPKARLKGIIAYIRRKSADEEGRAWISPEHDYPLGYAGSPEEFLDQLRALEEQGRIRHDERGYWVSSQE
ncbi:MAG: hypothetical protein ACM3RP_13310 [Chitinophagales bacterium]